jgi:ParB/RepB/Spo0J family partition protein
LRRWKLYYSNREETRTTADGKGGAVPRKNGGGGSAAAAAKGSQTDRTAINGAMAEAAGLRAAQAEAEAMSPAQVAVLPRAGLDEFWPHPLNPEHRHLSEDELAGLAEDIKRRGVLTPPLVAERAEVVRLDEDMAALIPEHVRFVHVDGHRRWAASKMAGKSDMPYLLRNELADPAVLAEVFLASNIHSQRLTPIEEARGYERLQKYGRAKSQTDLAALVSVSQGRVSKVMQLLKLPEVVQEAVDKSWISPHAARELLAVPSTDQEAAYRAALDDLEPDDRTVSERVGEAVRASVKRVLVRVEQAKAVQKARAALRKEGVTEIVPGEVFAGDEWRHELREDEVSGAREAGELAGAVVHDSGRITYYSTPPAPRHRVEDAAASYSNGIPAKPEGEKDRVGSADEEDGDDVAPIDDPGYSNGIAEDDDLGRPIVDPAPDEATAKEAAAAERALQSAADAHRGRVSAMRRVIADHEANTLVDVLADAVLFAAAAGVDFDEAGEVAAAAGADVKPSAIETLLLTGTRPAGHRAALAAALGVLESEAARAVYATGERPWPIAVQRHVRRLADLGQYDLTDYDSARLM